MRCKYTSRPSSAMLSLGAKVAVLASVLSFALSNSGVAAQAESSETSSSPAFIRDAASHVNLFIGTTNGGHTFPGEYAMSFLGCRG